METNVKSDSIINQFIVEEINKLSLSDPNGKAIGESIVQNRNVTFSLFGSSENISISIHPSAANRSFRENMHTHDYFELMYMYKGSAVQYFPDSEIPLPEGTVCLLSKNIQHQIQLNSEEDILIYIMIRPELLNQSFFYMLHDNEIFFRFFMESMFGDNAKGDYIIFDTDQNCSIKHIIESIIIEYAQKKVCYDSVIQSQIVYLFAEAIRHYMLRWEKTEDEQLSFVEITSYIRENLKDITLNDVADHFHYHQNTISRIIKKYSGKNFSTLVKELKLEKACTYLRTTQMPIKSIVDSLNYYDCSYFNRIFKKKYNITPSKYRKLYQHNSKAQKTLRQHSDK